MSIPTLRQYIRQVHDLQIFVLLFNITIHVHKAGRVRRNKKFSTGGQNIVHLLLGHTNSNRFMFYGECSFHMFTAEFHLLIQFILIRQGQHGSILSTTSESMDPKTLLFAVVLVMRAKGQNF